MRAPIAWVLIGTLVLFASAAAAQQPVQAEKPPVQTAKAAMPNAVVQQGKAIAEDPYMLTWEKEPRFRGRDPFETVLHTIGGPAGRTAPRLMAPRTPGEEAAFVARADAYVNEGNAALEEADYRTVKEKLEMLAEMTAMPLVTEPARVSMAEVKKAVEDLEARYSRIRARAALTEALQQAALMQAYFETGRYGEVISAEAAIKELDNEEGLRNPEVAATAADLLRKCADIKRRAEIHIEFGQKDLKVDAVSHFPGGRSFAIVNGEVYGEGGIVAAELTVATVAMNRVTFNYKGEDISLGMAE
jgi:hypothetical protein